MRLPQLGWLVEGPFLNLSYSDKLSGPWTDTRRRRPEIILVVNTSLTNWILYEKYFSTHDSPTLIYFIVIILLKITQAYQDLIIPWRNSLSPFPVKYISLPKDHGWVKAISEWRGLFTLNPVSSAASLRRIILKCWIATTVNNLPCIRKQSNTQKNTKVQDMRQVCYHILYKRYPGNLAMR